MSFGVVLSRRRRGERHQGRRIEHAKPEARVEKTAQRTVKISFREKSLTHRPKNRGALCAHSVPIVSADEIHPIFKRGGNTLLRGRRKSVSPKDVSHRAAIRYDVSLKAPITP